VKTRSKETAAKARYTRFHSTPQKRPAARGAAGSGFQQPAEMTGIAPVEGQREFRLLFL
jgi:hypothetical protein